MFFKPNFTDCDNNCFLVLLKLELFFFCQSMVKGEINNLKMPKNV